MPMPKGRPVCTVPGCDRENAARGVCGTHYKRLMKGQDLSAPIAPLRKYDPAAKCSVDQCDQPVKARGWCLNHYQRWWKRQGDPADDQRPSCYVCVHPMRGSIEAMISSGERLADVADGFGTTFKKLEWHLTHADVPRPTKAERHSGHVRCQVCTHPDLDLIEYLWSMRPPGLQRVHGPLSATALADRFGVDPSSLLRHHTPEHQQGRAMYALARLNALKETA